MKTLFTTLIFLTAFSYNALALFDNPPFSVDPDNLVLSYFSHILPDSSNMVNFSGRMQVVKTKNEARLVVYKSSPSRSMGSERHETVAVILHMTEIPNQAQVYKIVKVSRAADRFSQNIIFAQDGILDLSAAHEPAHSSPTLVLRPRSVKYTAPDGEVREIGFTLFPKLPCKDSLDMGGAA